MGKKRNNRSVHLDSVRTSRGVDRLEAGVNVDPLEQLRRIADRRAELLRQADELDGEQFAAVLDARLVRYTWVQLAAVLGVTPQAVQQRYAPGSADDKNSGSD